MPIRIKVKRFLWRLIPHQHDDEYDGGTYNDTVICLRCGRTESTINDEPSLPW